jgi:hypothetical protein
MLLLYFVAAGVLIGRLAGGRLSALSDTRFRWWGLALGGLGFQVLLFSPVLGSTVGDAGPALYVASTLVVLVALLRNIDLIGFPVIALGAALNLVVIVTNGGQMPADPAAFAALNGQPVVPTELFSNSSLAGTDTILPFLGDTMVLPRPLPFANVFSIGDVTIGIGAMIFLLFAMRGRPTPVRRPLAPPRVTIDGAPARGS